MPLSATATAPAGSRPRRRSAVSKRGRERAQVAVVDPDERRASGGSAIHLVSGVGLDQDVETELERRGEQVAQHAIVQGMATISSTASAPHARASATWYGSKMKSLRSNGNVHGGADRLEIARGCPWKWRSSVSTEIAAAPQAA